MQQSYSHLKSMLWATPGARVHAVIQGAKVPGLPALLQDADVPGWDCLWRGAQTPEKAAVAPYIVELGPESEFTDRVLRDLASAYPGWGVIGVGPVSLMAAREQGRRLLQVALPDGATHQWTWYDPVLWCGLLPQFDAFQLDEAFGPLTDWVVAGAQRWEWFTLSAGQLRTDVRERMAEQV